MPSKITVSCANCGTTIERWPSRFREGQKVYCSPECQNRARRKRLKVMCETCGNMFELCPSHLRDTGNYCSPECAYQSRRAEYGKPPLCACGCGLAVTGVRNGQWCRYIHGHNARTRECSSEAKANMSVAAKGITDHPSRFKPGVGNPAYKHGETAEHEANRPNWWQRAILREPILERDGRHCTLCPSIEDLCVHHIDGDVTNNDPANLQTVCATCHWKLSHD